MKRTTIEQSSNICVVGYDASKALLEIQFRGGGTYQYEGVPADVHKELLAADSVGRFFMREIRDKYPTVKLTAIESGLPSIDLKPGSYKIIRTDGTELVVKKKAALHLICKDIAAETLDTIVLRREPQVILMVVNDNGYNVTAVNRGPGRIEMVASKALFPENPKATSLYHSICKPGTTHKIEGDVAIVNDEDFA